MLAMDKRKSWKRERTLTDEEIGIAFIQRLNGASMKTLQKRLSVSRWTLLRHFKRFAEHLHEFGDLPSPRTRASVVELSKGIRRIHLSETIVDLYEVVQCRTLNGAATLRDFARIIGDGDVETKKAAETRTWHRFHEIAKRLQSFGIHLGKRHEKGSHWLDSRLVFSISRLRAFVNREIPHAEATLDDYKGSRGLSKRFVGNGSEEHRG